MKRILLALMICGSGAHALELEDIVAGARVGGLGTSYSTVAGDYQSIYINPAGLSTLQSDGISAGIGHYYTLPASNYHLGYYRHIYEGITTAAAWQSTRSNLKQFDRFYFTWSQTSPSPWLPLVADQKHSFSWGMSGRALSLQSRSTPGDNFKSKMGIGVDAGALIDLPETKSKIGGSIINLDSSNLLKGPVVTLGVSHRIRWANFMLDFRKRKGLSTFYPAVETSMYGDLLNVRVGRGMNLGKLNTVALGAGFNLLPLTIDFAVHMSPEGFHRKEGASMITVSYAFGGPRFYQKFTGVAAEEAHNLAREIDSMEARQRRQKAEAAELDRDLRVMREESRVMREKMREDTAEAEIRKAASERQGEEQEKIRKDAEWPKYRKVKPGDTLRAIAAQAYGDPNFWEVIYKANPDKIIRGLPKVGEVLTIPKP